MFEYLLVGAFAVAGDRLTYEAGGAQRVRCDETHLALRTSAPKVAPIDLSDSFRIQDMGRGPRRECVLFGFQIKVRGEVDVIHVSTFLIGPIVSPI